jgi:hypothetical protein
MKRFLNEKIGGEGICVGIFENKIDPIPDFYYTSKPVDIQSAISNLFFDVDQYSPEIDDSESNEYVYSEGKLRSIVKEETFPILQKYCETENSELTNLKYTTDLNSFNPTVQKSYTALLVTSGILLITLITFILG